jgi:hypothetical protein
MTYFHPKEQDKEEAPWLRRFELAKTALSDRSIDSHEFLNRIEQYKVFLRSMPVSYLLRLQG